VLESVLVLVSDRTTVNTTWLQNISYRFANFSTAVASLSPLSYLSSAVGQFDFDEVAHDFPSPRTGEPSLFPFNHSSLCMR
jgi:hypothetical protein